MGKSSRSPPPFMTGGDDVEGRTSQTRPSKGLPWWRSTRYTLAVLACFGYANFFFQRINLSMAVVCMVNHTALDQMTSHPGSPALPLVSSESLGNWSGVGSRLGYHGDGLDDESSGVFRADNTSGGASAENYEGGCQNQVLKQGDKEDGELLWSKETQGLVLGGLYWGYATCQVPAQRLIQYLGTKRSTLASVLLMSTLTLLCPLAARAGPWWFIAVRTLQGICSALGVPAIYALWGKWAPPQERTTLVSICFTGSHFANTLVYPISGLLCKSGLAGGWPSVFYVWGLVGLAWCVVWAWLAHDSPQQHPSMNQQEREYIIQSIGEDNPVGQVSIPWLKIFSSVPVWAIVVAQFGYNWCFFMFLAVLPQYMYEVMKFDIASNGFFTMLPYLCLCIFTNIWATICQKLQKSGVLSVTNVRKLSTAIGDVIPAALFVCVSFLDCTQAKTVVILMTLAIGISGTNLQVLGQYGNPAWGPRAIPSLLSLTLGLVL